MAYEEPIASISSRLNYAMSLRGISQSELARKAGITEASMSQYTTGKYEPKQQRIYILAQALSVSEEWLMGFDVPMDRKIGKASHYDYEVLISEREKYLIEIFKDMNESDQKLILSFAERLMKKQ